MRQQIQPLNPPKIQLPADQLAAVNQASTDAFHLAMLVNTLLLLAGAGVNALGLKGGVPAKAAAEGDPAPAPAARDVKGAESGG